MTPIQVLKAIMVSWIYAPLINVSSAMMKSNNKLL